MSQLTDYTEALLLDYLMTNSAVTRPTAWYAALYSVAPNDAGGGTELSGFGYARQVFNASTLLTATGEIGNSNLLTFTASGGDWSTAVAIGIFDALTGGNLLCWTPFATPITALDGDSVQVPSWGFSIQLD